ncbi:MULTISPECIES: hypothetical protein [Methylomonas]|uniref:hypothetical protein n=1 Tax=Methylomonas TaxID=416 RepID=UPI0012319854|nr:hypothetical protein [Methylomonas rhizoryzae]
MNLLWLIGSLTTASVVILITGVLLLIWRNKNQRHRDFERLLDDIKNRQTMRGNLLARRLADKLNVDKTDALGLSEQLITAEKLFLQQFIDQQMQQKPIEQFYEQLCELLDSYLAVTCPKCHASNSAPSSHDATPLTETTGSEPAHSENAANPDEPSWGDVFD